MANQDSTRKDSLSSRIRSYQLGYQTNTYKKFVLRALNRVIRFEESKTYKKPPDNV